MSTKSNLTQYIWKNSLRVKGYQKCNYGMSIRVVIYSGEVLASKSAKCWLWRRWWTAASSAKYSDQPRRNQPQQRYASLPELLSVLKEKVTSLAFFATFYYLLSLNNWYKIFDEICFMVRFRPFLFTAFTESIKISKIISGPRLKSLSPAKWPVSGACKVLNSARKAFERPTLAAQSGPTLNANFQFQNDFSRLQWHSMVLFASKRNIRRRCDGR